MSTSGTGKIYIYIKDLRMKSCFCSLTIGLRVIRLFQDRLLLQARMLTFMKMLTELFSFDFLCWFSACSAKMMYSVSCCRLFLLVLLWQAPGRCVMLATSFWKAPVGTHMPKSKAIQFKLTGGKCGRSWRHEVETVTPSTSLVCRWWLITVILFQQTLHLTLTHFLTGPALLYLILAVMNKKCNKN